MISLKSKTQFESQLFPGTTFVIKKYSAGRKHKLSLEIASLARQFNEVNRDIEPLRLQYLADCKAAPEDAPPPAPTELLAMIATRDNIICEFDHAWIKVAFVKIDGMEIDKAPFTAETLIEDAPEDLYQEFLAFTKREYGLSESERKNSLPPGTSPDQAVGPMTTSTAEPAKNAGTTSAEIAANTSPAT